MNKVNFGKIVKSLRLEHRDYKTGAKWSQQRLADEAQLTRNVISNIERGEKAKLYSEEIVGLVKALQLSTLEKEEFFFAATEVEKQHTAETLAQSAAAFDHAWHILATTKQPAFLIDPLFNLVGINQTMMTFHGLSDEMFDTATKIDIGVNVLDIMFRPNATLRQSMGERWEAIAHANLHQFRYTALSHRYMNQFDTFLSHMHTRPDFTRLWIETRVNPVDDFFSVLRRYDYTHTIHGPVCYAATLSTIATDHGNLYLTTHMPLDENTLIKFTELCKSCHGARKVMPWQGLQ